MLEGIERANLPKGKGSEGVESKICKKHSVLQEKGTTDSNSKGNDYLQCASNVYNKKGNKAFFKQKKRPVRQDRLPITRLKPQTFCISVSPTHS